MEITGSSGVIWMNGGHGRLGDAAPLALYRDGAITEFRDVETGWEQSFVLSTRHFLEVLSEGRASCADRARGPAGPALCTRRPGVRSGGQAGAGGCR